MIVTLYCTNEIATKKNKAKKIAFSLEQWGATAKVILAKQLVSV